MHREKYPTLTECLKKKGRNIVDKCLERGETYGKAKGMKPRINMESESRGDSFSGRLF